MTSAPSTAAASTPTATPSERQRWHRGTGTRRRSAGRGFGEITTEIVDAGAFYYAEEYHQQYLARNPHGYCNHGFCQVGYEPTAAAAG